MSFKNRFVWYRSVIPIAALSSPRACIADVFGDTHPLFGSARRGKSTLCMKGPNLSDGESSVQPLTTAIVPPAGSSTGWEPSLPLRGVISPDGSLLLLCRLLSLCLCHYSKNFMQSKVMISVTRVFWGKLLPPSLPVSRGSVRHYRQWWSKGKEWQLGTGLISEPTSKLFFFI